MQNRIWRVIGVLGIVLLVYGGLRTAEKGIIDLMLSEPPGSVISWQKNDSGEIGFTFAGKKASIDVLKIYERVLKMWDRLIRQSGRRRDIK